MKKPAARRFGAAEHRKLYRPQPRQWWPCSKGDPLGHCHKAVQSKVGSQSRLARDAYAVVSSQTTT